MLVLAVVFPFHVLVLASLVAFSSKREPCIHRAIRWDINQGSHDVNEGLVTIP